VTRGRTLTVLREGASALITTAAAAGACASIWWLASSLVGAAAGTSLASGMVLATVVALSLGRRAFASRAEFARSAALLPTIGLAAGAVGWLMVALPPVGAALFVAGMSVPIWLRRFGPRASRLGALVALPLTAILVVPVRPPTGGPPWLAPLIVLLSGVVAVLWVALGREAARLLPGRAAPSPAAEQPAEASASAATSAGSSAPASQSQPQPARLPASTRMALQMAVALTAAFVVGWLVFPEHAMWVVLTAFLVCSGNRGRADVVHKSALRILGALGGTIGAVALIAVGPEVSGLAAPQESGLAAIAVIFVALFAGTWLRAYSYAFWALTVTLVLSLLQELIGTASLSGETGMLAERMLAIVVGAVLGIAASWFVLPVRSVDVLRRRLSEMLTALSDVFPSEAPDRRTRVAAFHSAVARVEQLAPAHRATRLLRRRPGILPIDCIEAANALPAALDARLAQAHDSSDEGDRELLRSSIGRARRSLAAPVELARTREALDALAHALRGDPQS